jgi:hypothetical protein
MHPYSPGKRIEAVETGGLSDRKSRSSALQGMVQWILDPSRRKVTALAWQEAPDWATRLIVGTGRLLRHCPVRPEDPAIQFLPDLGSSW